MNGPPTAAGRIVSRTAVEDRAHQHERVPSKELAHTGITVNCVSLGIIATAEVKEMFRRGGRDQRDREGPLRLVHEEQSESEDPANSTVPKGGDARWRVDRR